MISLVKVDARCLQYNAGFKFYREFNRKLIFLMHWILLHSIGLQIPYPKRSIQLNFQKTLVSTHNPYNYR